MRVCFVTSNTFALNAFLAMPIQALAQRGWEVHVVVNTADGAVAPAICSSARVHPVDHARDISPLKDLVSLWRLWRLFRRIRPDVVHSVTPKAGLLAMTAARLAGVPCRMHTFTGQVWATREGAMRWLLRGVDRFFAACATRVLADSPSQREFMAGEGVAAAGRIGVLGEGSICGVDTQRFRPDAQARGQVRSRLGIGPDAPVLLYVGRLHPDKGLAELGAAFGQLASRHPDLHLVLAGPDEGGLALAQRGAGAASSRLHAVGMTREPERHMAAADVFCLPSYREGFGLSLLEAASAGLPCVASRIYGITDAVQDGATGLLVPVRDAPALAAAIERLLQDEALRSRLAAAARERALGRFSREAMMQHWMRLYEEVRQSV
ncbi:glycosyltransferase family 4 protein [Ramlibacter tataouinensis]|uniref:glycosyltransferase family 4 protein n=1 Tax=Ramlibacter tataouinensis TaxID=94132 RepID=UPI0022F3C45C|nr:glycosyltransferase family 4 protein [Ramlibacter tataouinensis]WBY00731.1 glycosyltransferase family 4 protein [Ramlibacter tataouinensis]